MWNFGRLLSAGALIAAAVSGSADATPVLVGNSNGSTFSNLSCVSCPQSSLTASSVILGSTAPGGRASTLSIVNTSFSASTDVLGLTLAELSLTVGQKPGVGQTGVDFNYNLLLSFSTPLASQSQTFSLALSGDGASGANADVFLSGLTPISLVDPLALSGVTLSNFRFGTVTGDTGSVFSNGTWDASAQGTTHLLYLLADVDVPVTVTLTNSVAPVPEPSTLLLFCAGLLGLIGVSLARKAKPVRG